jgi:hypothetical protein
LASRSFFDERIQQVLWMSTTGRVSKREEKALSLSMLFVLIPLYRPCEKSLLYPLVKKRPTGLLGDIYALESYRTQLVKVDTERAMLAATAASNERATAQHTDAGEDL